MRRGFGTKEVLLAVLVLIVFAAIMFPLGLGIVHRREDRFEMARLRQVFMAMALYEGDHAGAHPPTIADAEPYVPSDEWLICRHDPFAQAKGPFPCDGGNPKLPPTSKFRVSDAYYWTWVQTKDARDPGAFDSRQPWIADEWVGSVTPQDNFKAEVSGRFFRLNMDGALFVRQGPRRPTGDLTVLFR